MFIKRQLTVLVTLLAMMAFTATAYMFNPPQPEPASVGGAYPNSATSATTGTSMPLEATQILNHSLKRLELLSAAPVRRFRVETAFWKAEIDENIKSKSRMTPTQAAPDRKGMNRSSRDANQGHQGPGSIRSVAITCTVTTSADSGAGTLRQCLLDAVAGDTINFDPQAFPTNAPATITLLSLLPQITSDNLTIDGRNAGVILDGSTLATGTGLVINGANGVTIQGLHIFNFPVDGIELKGGTSNAVIGGYTADARNVISGNGDSAIWVHHSGTSGNQIVGNYIGTDATGTRSQGNHKWGIVITGGAQNNIVGGLTEDARNLISGNSGTGIQFEDNGTSGNQVLGNYIGTDPTGTTSLSNQKGVLIGYGAQNNIIGGSEEGAGNLISGNSNSGVWFQNEGTSGNKVLGNYIGTDLRGQLKISNFIGVLMGFDARNNIIGGEVEGAGNLISGNTQAGIQIQDGGTSGTSGNKVLGNYIGTNLTGTLSLSNTHGILISGAQNNIVGGQTEEARNVISGNAKTGINLRDSSTSGNEVLGNYIGSDASGTLFLDNEVGVSIAFGAQNNVVGGAGLARNVISGNRQVGIHLGEEGTSGNVIEGNYIGIDASGMARLGNLYGVSIGFGAQDNFIGGTTEEARNIISGNTQAGIQLAYLSNNESTSGNQVLGNYIGTDVFGMAPLSNTVGILIGDGAQANIIGGSKEGARNLISGNYRAGIHLQDTNDNQVLGNYIGTDVSGTGRLGNIRWGVNIGLGAQNNLISGNLISGNTEVGIQLQESGTSNNQVLDNHIGIDAEGTSRLGNAVGVSIVCDAQQNLIANNLISGNTEMGLMLFGRVKNDDNNCQTVNHNLIEGNYIGTNAMNSDLGNGSNGVHLMDGAISNTIGISNTIIHNGGAGIAIENTLRNTITRNIIYENMGLAIDWLEMPSIPAPPAFDSYSPQSQVISGSTCPNCRVEIFISPSSELAAATVFLTEVSANASGDFTLTLHNPPAYLSATSTDPDGNTSEFSISVIGELPTPTPTSSATPTVHTATPTATSSATPTPTSNVTPTATSSATPTVTVTATSTPNNSKEIYLPLITK